MSPDETSPDVTEAPEETEEEVESDPSEEKSC